MVDKCLHCHIVAALHEWANAHGSSERAADQRMIDPHHAIHSITKVMAEVVVLASKSSKVMQDLQTKAFGLFYLHCELAKSAAVDRAEASGSSKH